MATGYVELVQQATEAFADAYPGKAVTLYSAVGMPASGRARTQADLTNWEFLAYVGDGNEIYRLRYADGAFGDPSFASDGQEGLEPKQLPQGSVPLDRGIEILEQHGFTDGFENVGMGTPAAFEPQPMYWFCIPPRIQGVSSSTGEFFGDLFPCTERPGTLS